MTSQPSTLPADAVRKGHVRSYNSGAHKADVQLVGSMPRLLAGIRVATNIPAADCVVDREVTVLFFEHTNPADAVVLTVQGALPSGGGAFGCGDLAACSLANLGTRDHHLTTGLGDDDHPQYPLLAGRSPAQLLKGGTASGQHLTLQSTAHATRGYVRAQDDVQLLSNIIRDSAGTARLTLATASPHVSLTGDLAVSGAAAIDAASISPDTVLRVIGTRNTHPAVAGYFLMYGNRAGAPQFTYGLSGGARGQGTPSAAFVYGLYFFAQHDTPSYTYQLGGILVQQQSGASGTGPLSIARAYYASQGYWAGSKPGISIGLDIEDQGHALVTTAYGIRVLDQTGITSHLLDLGPSIAPYLRLLGNANPPANMTNLYLKEQATLRRVQWKAGNTLGAGDRVMVLV